MRRVPSRFVVVWFLCLLIIPTVVWFVGKRAQPIENKPLAELMARGLFFPAGHCEGVALGDHLALVEDVGAVGDAQGLGDAVVGDEDRDAQARQFADFLLEVFDGDDGGDDADL